jgi:hypothetical protein
MSPEISREQIKEWLISYDKFTVQELIDSNFDFGFYIWPKLPKGQIEGRYALPLLIAKLKEKKREFDCMIACWEWNPYQDPIIEIEKVMNDPKLKESSIKAIRDEINLADYEFSWQPNKEDINTIKVGRIFPIYLVNKDYLLKEILNVVSLFVRIRRELFRHLRPVE